MAIYTRGRGCELGTTQNKYSYRRGRDFDEGKGALSTPYRRGRDLNSGPPNCKSNNFNRSANTQNPLLHKTIP